MYWTMLVGLHLFHYHQHYTFGMGENICLWKNNGPLLTDPSNCLCSEFSPSFLNFRCSNMLESLFNLRLYWILFEWVFIVETRLPSRLSMFPFREHICFKKWWKSFLKNLQFSSDVEDWSWCSPQFDLHCSFLFAVMCALCVTLISLCPYKLPLCLSYALVCSQSFIKCKFLRWNLSYFPRFAFGNTFSNPGLFSIKSWVTWGDRAERYQITSYFTYYSQWISLKI